ncbi:hypothetical protein LXL04_030912 [Taraxacum kok-saghyz]
MAFGVFPTFSPHHIAETPKISKVSYSKLEIGRKSLCSKSRLKLRANAKTTQSDSDRDHDHDHDTLGKVSLKHLLVIHHIHGFWSFPTFSPHHIAETSKISKVSYSKLENGRKSLCSKFRLKLRANAKTTQSDSDRDHDHDHDTLGKFLKRDYDSKYGFSQKVDSFTIPKGLSENTIRLISSTKKEPDWMLEFRLNSYHKFCQMTEPNRFLKIKTLIFLGLHYMG